MNTSSLHVPTKNDAVSTEPLTDISSLRLDTILDGIADEIDDDYKQPTPTVPADIEVKRIDEWFTYEDVLGEGVSCRVLLSRNLRSNQQVALKELVKKKDGNQALFTQEKQALELLQPLQHPNIVEYHGTFTTRGCHYLSMEYCSGGTLLDKIMSFQGAYFNEQRAIFLISNILDAVDSLHRLNIVHRDLKCQNICFDKEGPDAVLKVIDFGNAEVITHPDEIDNLFCGSLHYIAPEVCRAHYVQPKKELFKSDMWSVGVIAYIICSGRIPFFGKTDAEVMRKIIKGDFAWPDNVDLSEGCKDFISSLLCVDIEKRFSVKEALDHDWIVNDDEFMSPMSGLGSLHFEEHDFDDIEDFIDEILDKECK